MQVNPRGFWRLVRNVNFIGGRSVYCMLYSNSYSPGMFKLCLTVSPELLFMAWASIVPRPSICLLLTQISQKLLHVSWPGFIGSCIYTISTDTFSQFSALKFSQLFFFSFPLTWDMGYGSTISKCYSFNFYPI